MKNWDGTGKHPVLGKTREEILAMNEVVTEKHVADHAESAEAAPQPDFSQETIIQTTRAQEMQALAAERLTESLKS